MTEVVLNKEMILMAKLIQMIRLTEKNQKFHLVFFSLLLLADWEPLQRTAAPSVSGWNYTLSTLAYIL